MGTDAASGLAALLLDFKGPGAITDSLHAWVPSGHAADDVPPPLRSEAQNALALCVDWYLARGQPARALELVATALDRQRRIAELQSPQHALGAAQAELSALHELAAAAALACATAQQPAAWPELSARGPGGGTAAFVAAAPGSHEQLVQQHFGVPDAVQRAVSLREWPQALQASVLAGIAAARGELDAHATMAFAAQLLKLRCAVSYAAGAAHTPAMLLARSSGMNSAAGAPTRLGAGEAAVARVCQAIEQQTVEHAVPLLSDLVSAPDDIVALERAAVKQESAEGSPAEQQTAEEHARVQAALKAAVDAADGMQGFADVVAAALSLLPAMRAVLSAVQNAHTRGTTIGAVLSAVLLRWVLAGLEGGAGAAPAHTSPATHEHDGNEEAPGFVRHLLSQLCEATGHVEVVGAALQFAMSPGTQTENVGAQQAEAASATHAQPQQTRESVCSGSMAAHVLRASRALFAGDAAALAAAAGTLRERLPASRHVDRVATCMVASSVPRQECAVRVAGGILAAQGVLSTRASEHAPSVDASWLAQGSEDRWHSASGPQRPHGVPCAQVMRAVAARTLARPDGARQARQLCEHWQVALTALRSGDAADAPGLDGGLLGTARQGRLDECQREIDAVRCAVLMRNAAEVAVAAGPGTAADAGAAASSTPLAAGKPWTSAEPLERAACEATREWLVALAAAMASDGAQHATTPEVPCAAATLPHDTQAHPLDEHEAAPVAQALDAAALAPEDGSTTPPPPKRPRLEAAAGVSDEELGALGARGAGAAEWVVAVSQHSRGCALVQAICGVLQAAMRVGATHASQGKPAPSRPHAASPPREDTGGVCSATQQPEAVRQRGPEALPWAPVFGVLAGVCHPITAACCGSRGAEGTGMAALRRLAYAPSELERVLPSLGTDMVRSAAA